MFVSRSRRRGEERRGEERRGERQLCNIALLIAIGTLSARATAQAGTWEVAFNHEYRTARSYQAGTEWPASCSTCPTFPFGENPISGPPFTSGSPATTRQFNASHMTLVVKGPYQGQVLVWEGDAGYRTGRFIPGTSRYSILNPDLATQSTGVMFRNFYVDLVDPNTTPATNLGTMFCTGGVWTQEGLFFVPGGSHPDSVTPPYLWPFGGSKLVAVFDPSIPDNRVHVADVGRWWLAADADRLYRFRWYPTALHASQGSRRVLTFGGQEKTGAPQQNYESYRVLGGQNVAYETWPSGTDPRLFSGPSATHFPEFWNFPRFHLLTTGDAFLSVSMDDHGSARRTHVPNQNNPAWPTFGTAGLPSTSSWTSSVLLPNLGGLNNRVMRVARGPFGSTSVEVATATANNVTWSPISGTGSWPQLRSTRDHPNAVLLPDGSVLVLTGELWPTQGVQPRPEDWVRPELLRLRDAGLPGFAWAYGDHAMNHGGSRGYHSCAVLLPDGRVLVAGGELRTKDYAIFRPYYLDLGGRPEITLSPTGPMRYPPAGQSYRFNTSWLGFGQNAEKIVLMRPGVCTHHSDMEQRYVELQTIAINELPDGSGIEIEVAPPASENHAPPGYYMAFAVSPIGIPSKAVWVQVTP